MRFDAEYNDIGGGKSCRWYAGWEGTCCNGECPARAEVCPFTVDEQVRCEFYEQENQ